MKAAKAKSSVRKRPDKKSKHSKSVYGFDLSYAGSIDSYDAIEAALVEAGHRVGGYKDATPFKVASGLRIPHGVRIFRVLSAREALNGRPAWRHEFDRVARVILVGPCSADFHPERIFALSGFHDVDVQIG